MPTRTEVEQLISLVEKGQFVEAIEMFYADDAVTQENGQPPCVGLPALLDRERGFLARIKSIKARLTPEVLVDGDRVVIHWVFDIVDGKNRVYRLDELAYQLWRGGKIVRETYYYDPAQMQTPVSS